MQGRRKGHSSGISSLQGNPILRTKRLLGGHFVAAGVYMNSRAVLICFLLVVDNGQMLEFIQSAISGF